MRRRVRCTGRAATVRRKTVEEGRGRVVDVLCVCGACDRYNARDAARVRALSSRLCVRQGELARALGVCEAALSNWPGTAWNGRMAVGACGLLLAPSLGACSLVVDGVLEFQMGKYNNNLKRMSSECISCLACADLKVSRKR